MLLLLLLGRGVVGVIGIRVILVILVVPPVVVTTASIPAMTVIISTMEVATSVIVIVMVEWLVIEWRPGRARSNWRGIPIETRLREPSSGIKHWCVIRSRLWVRTIIISIKGIWGTSVRGSAWHRTACIRSTLEARLGIGSTERRSWSCWARIRSLLAIRHWGDGAWNCDRRYIVWRWRETRNNQSSALFLLDRALCLRLLLLLLRLLWRRLLMPHCAAVCR